MWEVFKTHPIRFLWEGVKQQARDVGVFAKFSLEHPEMLAPGAAATSPSLTILHATDPERAAAVLRGAANVASFAVGGAAGTAAIQIAGRALLPKVGAFLASEALGGATYGAIRPTEEGESRGQAMATDAALFTAFGSVTMGVGAGVRTGGRAGTRAIKSLLAKSLEGGMAPPSLTDAPLVESAMGEPHPRIEAIAQMNDALDQAVAEIKPFDLTPPALQAEGERVARSSGRELGQAIAQRQPTSDLWDRLLEGAGTLDDLVPESPRGPGPAFQGWEGIRPRGDGGSAAAPGFRDMEVLSKLPEEQLKELGAATLRLFNRAGAIPARTLMGMTGTGLYLWGETGDELPRGLQAGLKGFGAFLALASVTGSPGMRRVFSKPGKLHDLAVTLNPTAWISGEAQTALGRNVAGPMAQGTFLGAGVRRDVLEIFPGKNGTAKLAFALDAGPTSEAWSVLTPAQQDFALHIRGLMQHMGRLGKDQGFISGFLEDYYPHVWPRIQGVSGTATGSMTMGNLVKERRMSLVDGLAWAESRKIQGPRLDAENVIGDYFERWHKAYATHNLTNWLTDAGMLMKPEGIPSATHPLGQRITQDMPGWRFVRGVRGLDGYVAPEGLAQVLENLTGSGRWSGKALKAVDEVRSYMMRAIMLWAWEHGSNVVRGLVTAVGNPLTLGKAWRAVREAEPGLLEASRHGLLVGGRPDFAGAGHLTQLLDRLVERASKAPGGAITAPTIAALQQAGYKVWEWNERMLWDRLVPSMGYAAYTNEMMKWARRTKGRFGPESAEYAAAGHRAAHFANTAMGLVPKYLQDPQAEQIMRLALFSPSWLRTRATLTVRAAGEAGQILSGEMPLRELLHPDGQASYLKAKVRQVVWGVGVTTTLSYVLTGKPPEFNPKTNKFYARTGAFDERGREIGLDMLGWWQDDLRAADHPLRFLWSKVNPVIPAAQAQFVGKDTQGREMSAPEQVEDLVGRFGPAADALKLIGRVGENQTMTAADKVRAATDVLAVGNAAMLPRPMDAALGKLSERLLRQFDVPATSDRTRELAQILRSNVLRGQSVLTDEAIHYLLYQQEALKKYNSWTWKWQRAKRELANWWRDAVASNSVPVTQPEPGPAPMP